MVNMPFPLYGPPPHRDSIHSGAPYSTFSTPARGEHYLSFTLLLLPLNISPRQSFKSTTVIQKSHRGGYTGFDNEHTADPMTGFDDATERSSPTVRKRGHVPKTSKGLGQLSFRPHFSLPYYQSMTLSLMTHFELRRRTKSYKDHADDF
jgi:hypothetical protein